MIELQAVVTCDRCSTGCKMFFACWTEAEAEHRLCLTPGWGPDEDGHHVCPECWAKYDAAQVAKAGEARTSDKHDVSSSSEPDGERARTQGGAPDRGNRQR